VANKAHAATVNPLSGGWWGEKVGGGGAVEKQKGSRTNGPKDSESVK